MHETLTDKSPIQIHTNKIQNRVIFNIKSEYYLELLMPKTMKLPGSTEQIINKDKIGDNVQQREITEVVLLHWNILNNQYQHDSRVLSTFVARQSFGQLLHISPKNQIIYSGNFHSDFSYIKVWFTNQNSLPLEIEDRVNLNLIINDGSIY